MPERLFFVGILEKHEEKWEKIDSLDELCSLGKTAGGEVVEKILQRRDRIDPKYFIGKGKAQQLGEIARDLNIDTFCFDCELTPTQVRNLEDTTGRKVIDRTELILDIFAQHARTKAAKIEVELTQLNYRLSRLSGKGITLSRLGGGIGTRGPGEQKLEVDRRRTKERINRLGKSLKKIEISKKIQSKKRKNLFRIALVGYTNTGKSSIMNALTKSNLLVDDKLFSTLDATTRVLSHQSTGAQEHQNTKILITDTIGFVRRLPHGLITSFKSTLDEAITSDLRLHIIDVSHPHSEIQIQAGNEVLEALGIIDKQTLLVFNKIDKDNMNSRYLKEKYPDAFFTSCVTGKGIEELKSFILQIAKNYVS